MLECSEYEVINFTSQGDPKGAKETQKEPRSQGDKVFFGKACGIRVKGLVL